jgi:hypothetical protein
VYQIVGKTHNVATSSDSTAGTIQILFRSGAIIRSAA